ncbi:tyrosyl-DNA phosphodiesterase I [Mucor lusitanicus]
MGCGMMSLKDLIYHNDLMSMVQFNFMVDVEFLMSNVKNKSMPVTVVHGLRESARDLAQQARQWPNVTVATPRIQDRYGVHHTKAMILYFRDAIQLIVMTANMVPQDWQVMTQGVYRSPKCSLKTNGSNTSAASPFESDLIKYLRAYNLSCLSSTIASIARYDWSVCKAILIASVPGYHRQSESSFSNWGLERLSEVLRQHVTLPAHNCQNSQVIMQCSSMPHSPEKWFKEQVSRAMAEFKNRRSTPSIKPPRVGVVYPTMAAASNSFTGRDMSGDFLRFEKAAYDKNHAWFDPYLYEWKSERAGRQFLMPHIKTYTRTYEDKNGRIHIAWHLLTSANLSRAAWGDYQKNRTQIYIKSYELGVLFCASLWDDNIDLVPDNDLESSTSSVQEESSGTEVTEIKVRLPFDLPLIHHPEPLQCFTRLT